MAAAGSYCCNANSGPNTFPPYTVSRCGKADIFACVDPALGPVTQLIEQVLQRLGLLVGYAHRDHERRAPYLRGVSDDVTIRALIYQ